MKLSHLSIAIFSAIALSACGGSSSKSPTEDTPIKETPTQPVPDETPKDDEKIVDPTQTGVVGKLDLAKSSSQGTTQYIRADGSKFDRDNNPSDETSSTAIFGVDLNEQNPWLTNIALAQLKDQGGEAVLVQYLGVDKNNAPKITSPYSIQTQNTENVDVREVFSNKSGTANWHKVADVNDVQDQIKYLDKWIASYEGAASLTKEEQKQLAKLQNLRDVLSDVEDALTDNPDYQTGLVVLNHYKYKGYRWGDLVKTQSGTLDSGNKGTTYSPDYAKNPHALGLVAINFPTEQGKTADKVGNVQGEEEQSLSSTRFFGRNYDRRADKVVSNSYMEGPTVLLDNSMSDIPDLSGTQTYQDYASEIGGTKDNLKYHLGVRPNKLLNVQYGRVTGNLDPLKLTDKERAAGKRVYKRSDFVIKSNKKAVDTYFYRGTDATTIEQMAAMPKGKEFTYNGHALMYGIDNNFHGKVGSAVPSAFGASDKHGIGNFVTAKVDLDKGRVKGSIYNVWQKDFDKEVVRDALVSFDGNIFGNTVLGEAQRTYDTSDRADFRASFFGEKADEMGGSINSTTWQERYGAKGDVWGGVFGASRVEDVSTLTNQWLGDIPDLTSASSKK